MNEHSILAPSSAARRRQCPQSTTWEAMYPETEPTSDSAEGTAVHWACSEMLEGREIDVGVIAENGVVLTVEMLDAADLYVDDVTSTLAKYGLTPADGHIEERTEIPRVHPQSWGTPDFWIYVPAANTYLLWDFKYGHRHVEVFENPQLIEYAAGVTNGDPGNPHVHLRLVQPRSFHRGGPVREWRTTLLDLRAHVNISSNAAHEALGPVPRLRTGPECRDCRARHACPALQAEGYAGVDLARGTTPVELSPAALSLEARTLAQAADLIKARLGGLQAQMEQLLKSGTNVPGWSLVRGQGRERWIRPASEIIAMGAVLNVDVSKPVEAMTPAQARKAGIPAEVVEALSERPGGSLSVEMTNEADVARVFS